MSALSLTRRAVLAAAGLALAGRARAAPASRIVCAGTDVTETVVALAGIGSVRGVDSTSRTPPEVRALPSIGYLRQISVEGILSLEPDLLISNRDIGPEAVLAQLRGTGLRVEIVSGELNGSGIAAKIRRIGIVLERSVEAERLAASVEARMAALAGRLAGITARPSLAFVRAVDNGLMITAGRLPLVDAAFALAGGRNAFDSFSVFKAVSRESFAAAPPDFLVTSPETAASAGGSDGFLALAGLSEGGAGRLVVAETTSLFGFAPSSVEVLEALAQRIHPERFGATP